MAISFPTSLDALTNPQTTDALNSPSHTTQHGDINDAVEALEAKVGTDSSSVTTSHDYKLTNLETGWTASADTWTYASATAFTISGVNRTNVFYPGTRIRVTQSSAYKYFVVTSRSFSTNTTVNITGGTDYTLANASITNPLYSYAANPVGMPMWFTWTPTWSLSGGTLTTTYTQQTGKFSVVGRMCTATFKMTLNTVSAATANKAFSCTIPVTPVDYSTDYFGRGNAIYIDSGTDINSLTPVFVAASDMRFYKGNTGASNHFGVDPAKTLATGDQLNGTIIYEI